MTSQFTFGSDPEFALTYKNRLKSAIGVLPEKDKSIKMQGHAFYFDNVLAEISIRPSASKGEAVETFRQSLKMLAEVIHPIRPSIQASMMYPTSELKSKKAQEAGCVAEYSAYSLARIMPPKDFVVKDEDTEEMRHVTPFRTVGGHVHLGAEEGPLQHGMLTPYVVKMMDLFLGVPELFFNKDKTSKDRRQVYGVAGSHRRPVYGVEYRPLSNFWLSSPLYVALVYDLSEFALSFVAKNGHLKFWEIADELLDEDDPSVAHHCYGYDAHKLCYALDYYDTKAAEPFMTFISSYLPRRLSRSIEDAVNHRPEELYKEWGIE